MPASQPTKWFLIGLSVVVVAVVVHDALRSRPSSAGAPSVAPPGLEPEVRRGLDKTPLLYSSEYMRNLATEVEPALVTAWPDVATGLRASGCFIAPDGEVLIALRVAATRWHVLPGRGGPLEATLVGADAIHGVGLLRVAVGRPVPFVRFHDPPRTSAGELLIGMVGPRGPADLRLIVAPGTPETLTERLAREPLDSGETVTNLDGALVAFGAGPPADVRPLDVELLAEIVASLRAEGRHPHPWLGVELQTIDAGLRRYFTEGSIVAVHVVPDSPADRAGVEAGMVFTEATVGARTATTAGAVQALLFPEAEVRFASPGSDTPIAVSVDDLQIPPGFGDRDSVAIVPATGEPGVPIRVGVRGQAALAGLVDGDMVEAVDLRPVRTAVQLRQRLASPRAHLLTVRRGDRRFFVALPPDEAGARPSRP